MEIQHGLLLANPDIIVRQFRVIIPDHIGCGLSEKPQDWSYQLADHIQKSYRFVVVVEVENIHLVVHDWGGAIGMGFATKYPEKISSITITNTAAFRSQEIPLSIASCRVPILDRWLFEDAMLLPA